MTDIIIYLIETLIGNVFLLAFGFVTSFSFATKGFTHWFSTPLLLAAVVGMYMGELPLHTKIEATVVSALGILLGYLFGVRWHRRRAKQQPDR